ncbi:hypothetical protein GQ600_16977 [Phytophthora cactorum]|nr:hypothetical protein GQ600_16977 [Phytophthora cactorum]
MGFHQEISGSPSSSQYHHGGLETLSGEATYESASDLLGQFKQVLPDRRPKQQIAYKVAQLPPGKPITDASKFTRYLRGNCYESATRR